MTDLIEDKREMIARACARHGVARLDVFGSSLRSDFRPTESDFDLLVVFQPMESAARVEAYFGLLTELRGLFGSRVDLVMVGAIKHPYIADEIARTRQQLYAA